MHPCTGLLAPPWPTSIRLVRQVFTTMEAATERCKALDEAKRSAMYDYLSQCHADVLSPLQVGWRFSSANAGGRAAALRGVVSG